MANRFRSRGGKTIDNTRWVAFSLADTLEAAGASAQTFLTSGTMPETILRIRGNVLAYIDATQAPGTFVKVGMGLIIMPEGTGSTVTSSPISDSNAPWLWHIQFALAYEEYVTDVVANQVASGFRGVIDSKAMRRIRPDREVQFVIENVTVGGAGAIALSVDGRMLLGS